MIQFRSLTKFLAFVAITVTIVAAAGPVGAAKGERTARVAGGEQVTLAKSRYSSRELKARRPQMESLHPRAR